MVTRSRKLLSVAAILTTGMALAWPFRLDHSQTADSDQPPIAASQADLASPFPLGPGVSDSLQSPSHTSPSYTDEQSPAQRLPGPLPLSDPHAGREIPPHPFEPVHAQATSHEHLALRPSLVPSPPPGPSPFDTGARLPAAGTSEDSATGARFVYPSLAAPSSPDTAEDAADNAPWRPYILHDGDTLAKLAERYLGDESRALELFDLNRGTLENPYLLPIGIEIKIPRPNRAAASLDREL